MILFQCDICKNEFTSIGELTYLKERFRTKGIKDVCYTCSNKIDSKEVDEDTKASYIIDVNIKKYIQELKGKKC